MNNSFLRPPNISVIPFKFNEAAQYDQLQLSRIQSAMAAIEQNSCIRFEPLTDATFMKYASSYVEILNESGGGCHSVIGRKRDEAISKVKLEKKPAAEKTCIAHHVVLHELLHLLGLYHEHQRPDRFKWMDIDLENVIEKRRDNYKTIR